MNKLIITAALVGSLPTEAQNSKVPQSKTVQNLSTMLSAMAAQTKK